MDSVDSGSASTADQEIHKKALAALAHYYKYRDSVLLTRVVLTLPNSNRRVAMLEWIKKFSVLHWDRVRGILVRRKCPEQQDFDGACHLPFWTFKVKQERRRHVSGNTFEPELFFDRVIADIQANIDLLSVIKLEQAIAALQKLAEDKRARVAKKNIFGR